MGDIIVQYDTELVQHAVVGYLTSNNRLLFSRREHTLSGAPVDNALKTSAVKWEQFRLVGRFAENWDDKAKVKEQLQEFLGKGGAKGKTTRGKGKGKGKGKGGGTKRKADDDGDDAGVDYGDDDLYGYDYPSDDDLGYNWPISTPTYKPPPTKVTKKPRGGARGKRGRAQAHRSKKAA